MTDAGGWTELPIGQDIAVRAGVTYAVIASISESYSRADLEKQVPLGVDLVDYNENPAELGPDPADHHRLVALKFFAHRDVGTLPWKSPWPTTIYHLVRAWAATGSANEPVPTAGVSSGSPVGWWLAGAAALGVLSWAGWRLLRARPSRR